VKFEDGLSILAMKNKATHHRDLRLEIEKVSKKVKSLAYLIHTPPFFKLLCAVTLGTLAYQSFQGDWDMFKRAKS
jgi:hypothetical protein